jgi:DNA mismatch repair protein MutS
MTALADSLPRAINLQVAVAEEKGEVVFLHRILEGGADRSYGVYVGRLAGLPQPVIARAWELLAELEAGSTGGLRDGRANGASTVDGHQLPLLQPDSALREAIQGLNISEMTPLEAITKLYELQQETQNTPNTPNSKDDG